MVGEEYRFIGVMAARDEGRRRGRGWGLPSPYEGVKAARILSGARRSGWSRADRVRTKDSTQDQEYEILLCDSGSAGVQVT